jgi:hypothetical protein
MERERENEVKKFKWERREDGGNQSVREKENSTYNKRKRERGKI